MEEEIRRQRIAILRGVKMSAEQMLHEKAEKDSVIAISNGDHVEIIRAKKLVH